MLTSRRVVERLRIPMTSPLIDNAVGFLILDHIHVTSRVVWGVFWALCVIEWFWFVVSVVTEVEVDPFEGRP